MLKINNSIENARLLDYIATAQFKRLAQLSDK
jgi:hypothetical protein